MRLTPDFTIRETAVLSGATRRMVEQIVKSGVLDVFQHRGASDGRVVQYLPIQAVTYFALLYKAGTAAQVDKDALWQELSHRDPDDLEAVEIPTAMRQKAEGAARAATARARRYSHAKEAHIVKDPRVLGGTPVIRGTRLSARAVHKRLSAGETVEDLIEAYPSVPREAIEAAEIYARSHPIRERAGGKPWRSARR